MKVQPTIVCSAVSPEFCFVFPSVVVLLSLLLLLLVLLRSALLQLQLQFLFLRSLDSNLTDIK